MGSGISKAEISKLLSDEGLFVLPEAAEAIKDYEKPSELVEIVKEEYEEGTTVDQDKIDEVKDSENSAEDDEDGHEEEEYAGVDNRNQVEDTESDDSDENLDTESNGEDDTTTDEYDIQEPNTNVDSDISSGDPIDPSQALTDIQNRVSDTKDAKQVINRKETLDDRYPEWCDTMFNRELSESKDRIDVDPNDYEVMGDVTGRSRGTGEFDDFRALFEDRYEEMVNLLDNRVGGARRVSDIRPRRHGGESITVVGIVWDTFVSKNGNYFIDLEDPSTNDLMRVGWTDDWIKESFEQVIPDEVIAVRGNLAEDGDIIWGDGEVRRGRPPIMFPDVPRKKSRSKPDRKIEAALISDVHVGADEFYPSYWNDFVDWIRETPTVKYLFIGGDLVEGIGVYPDQDEELHVLDIHDQYAMMGRMLDQIPDDVTIFAGVGNHDTVRLAEPQPTHPEKFQKYYPDNVEFVGNPVTIEASGVNFLMYHGMSINALSEVVPGLDPENPIPIMELLLKKRHVAPVYGKNVRLAPEEKDYLVIDKVPDVLHCGHVHQYSKDTYNGVRMTNTATWQGQTDFQKSKGINPDVGYWSVVNLSTLELEEYSVDNL